MNNVEIKTKFNVGDELSVVYSDGDIGAWNVETVRCGAIRVIITEDGQKVEYLEDEDDDYCFGDNEDDLFFHSLDAAIEAKRRNIARAKIS